LGVAQLEGCDLFLGGVIDVFDHSVSEEFDLFVLARAFQHDLGGAEVIAAMDDCDLRREAGEEEGFLHGRIAATDDGYRFVFKKETVASCAG